MLSQNHHLNLFRFFNENETDEYLENNLSRALAICLQREPAFLLDFLRAILRPDDQKKVLSIPPHGDSVLIDIQQGVKDIDITSVQTVYAVAMSGEDFDKAMYESTQARNHTDNPVTDLIIFYQGILIIIEVKRTAENCLAQLKEQVEKLMASNDEGATPEVVFKSYSWKNATKLCQEVAHLHELSGYSFSYCSDLYELIANRFSGWLDTRPFDYINFDKNTPPGERWIAEQRLMQAMQETPKYKNIHTGRTAWLVDFKWADEVIAGFITEESGSYLQLSMYPGNTKGQGGHLFFKDNFTTWMSQGTLSVNGDDYPIGYGLHIKFAGFQGRYISGLFIYEQKTKDHLQKHLYRTENFYKSGKYKRNRWDEFCQFFDQVFPADFDWRSEIGWQDNFVNSGRNEFSVSFGFEAWVRIPYKKLQDLDKDYGSPTVLGAYLEQAVSALGNLIK